MQTKPLIIGHRGAPGYRPEHTRSSYLLAFAQGVDAVEPDIVLTKDGVPVIRHENEIGGTTDVAEHPEFQDRFTKKIVDGENLEGWFTEDFTWAELQTLKCRERLPGVRPENTLHNDKEEILRLRDLLDLVWQNHAEGGSVSLVIELKHVQYFEDLGFNLVKEVFYELTSYKHLGVLNNLTIECFEPTALKEMREFGLSAKYVFLMEIAGSPADEIANKGKNARSYEWFRSEQGLETVADFADGISVDKENLFEVSVTGEFVLQDIVQRAHEKNLLVFTWTLRPENSFLNQKFVRGAETAFGDYISEWQSILQSGVDGLFIDHPDLIIPLLS